MTDKKISCLLKSVRVFCCCHLGIQPDPLSDLPQPCDLETMFLRLLVTVSMLQRDLQTARCNPMKYGLPLVPFKERTGVKEVVTWPKPLWDEVSLWNLSDLRFFILPTLYQRKKQKFSNQPETLGALGKKKSLTIQKASIWNIYLFRISYIILNSKLLKNY